MLNADVGNDKGDGCQRRTTTMRNVQTLDAAALTTASLAYADDADREAAMLAFSDADREAVLLAEPDSNTGLVPGVHAEIQGHLLASAFADANAPGFQNQPTMTSAVGHDYNPAPGPDSVSGPLKSEEDSDEESTNSSSDEFLARRGYGFNSGAGYPGPCAEQLDTEMVSPGNDSGNQHNFNAKPVFSYQTQPEQYGPFQNQAYHYVQPSHGGGGEHDFMERAIAAVEAPPLREPSPPPEQPSGAAPETVYHMLQLGYNAKRYQDGAPLMDANVGAEYADNEASFQSELFELGQAESSGVHGSGAAPSGITSAAGSASRVSTGPSFGETSLPDMVTSALASILPAEAIESETDVKLMASAALATVLPEEEISSDAAQIEIPSVASVVGPQFAQNIAVSGMGPYSVLQDEISQGTSESSSTSALIDDTSTELEIVIPEIPEVEMVKATQEMAPVTDGPKAAADDTETGSSTGPGCAAKAGLSTSCAPDVRPSTSASGSAMAGSSTLDDAKAGSSGSAAAISGPSTSGTANAKLSGSSLDDELPPYEEDTLCFPVGPRARRSIPIPFPSMRSEPKINTIQLPDCPDNANFQERLDHMLKVMAASVGAPQAYEPPTAEEIGPIVPAPGVIRTSSSNNTRPTSISRNPLRVINRNDDSDDSDDSSEGIQDVQMAHGEAGLRMYRPPVVRAPEQEQRQEDEAEPIDDWADDLGRNGERDGDGDGDDDDDDREAPENVEGQVPEESPESSGIAEALRSAVNFFDRIDSEEGGIRGEGEAGGEDAPAPAADADDVADADADAPVAAAGEDDEENTDKAAATAADGDTAGTATADVGTVGAPAGVDAADAEAANAGVARTTVGVEVANAGAEGTTASDETNTAGVEVAAAGIAVSAAGTGAADVAAKGATTGVKAAGAENAAVADVESETAGERFESNKRKRKADDNVAAADAEAASLDEIATGAGASANAERGAGADVSVEEVAGAEGGAGATDVDVAAGHSADIATNVAAGNAADVAGDTATDIVSGNTANVVAAGVSVDVAAAGDAAGMASGDAAGAGPSSKSKQRNRKRSAASKERNGAKKAPKAATAAKAAKPAKEAKRARKSADIPTTSRVLRSQKPAAPSDA